MAATWSPWAKWGALAAGLCLALTYFVFVQERVPHLLSLAAGIQASRHEVWVVLLLFFLMVVSVPLAIVPTGSLMLAAATLGYVYGIWGICLAWPGLSLGLALCFALARAMRLSSGPRTKSNAAGGGACDFDRFFEGRTATAILRGTRRLLREQPKRTAILLTFATHAPATQFLLGGATDILWTDSLLACCVDGCKAIVPLLKGMAIRDLIELAEGAKAGGTSPAHEAASLALKVAIFCALVAVFLLAARSVLHEIHEEGEAEALLRNSPTQPTAFPPGTPKRGPSQATEECGLLGCCTCGGGQTA